MKLIDTLYSPGTLSEVGCVPKKMYAWTLRNENLGAPKTAFREEVVNTPLPGAGEVLVAVVAAGVNYNGVWAASGKPKNVIDSNGDYLDPKEDFHICGSEASGIVYAVGENVTNVAVGDPVMISGARYDRNCVSIQDGIEPEYSPTYHIWGYESNWGAFAQFCKVFDYQCVKKPDSFRWEEAATIGATSVPVHRMLCHWKDNQVQKGDVVLIWGGSGGLGSTAIQQVAAMGAIPVAVVSSEERGAYCMKLGAKGYIDRTKYTHWGTLHVAEGVEYTKWVVEATKFRNEIYSVVGKKQNPAIVIEHPGSDTLSTSLFVCRAGGMVVLCGATSGYIAPIDLRHLWMYQKRIQGSHAGSAVDFENYVALKKQYDIPDVVSKVYAWKALAVAHQDFADGKIRGKAVIRVVEDAALQ